MRKCADLNDYSLILLFVVKKFSRVKFSYFFCDDYEIFLATKMSQTKVHDVLYYLDDVLFVVYFCYKRSSIRPPPGPGAREYRSSSLFRLRDPDMRLVLF